LNNDGHPDLVAAINGTHFKGVSVLHGKGDGTFTTPQNIQLSGGVVSVAISDMNDDGYPDIVAAVANSSALTTEVAVLLGKGDGTFKSPQYSPGGALFQSLAVKDINGDGRPDVVVTTPGIFFGSPSVSVLIGNGDGTFQAPQSYAAEEAPESVSIADLNGDDKQDIVVSNLIRDGTISVLLGNGDGSFQAPQSYASGNAPVPLAVADVNGDGHLDVITGGRYTASILLGEGDGTFKSPETFEVGLTPAGALASTSLYGLSVSDVNGDGHPDLVFTDTATNTVAVVLGKGDGSFRAPNYYAVGFLPTSVAVADANGDGQPDLFIANEGGHTSTVGVLLHLASSQSPVADDGTLTTDENKPASGTLKASDPEGNSLTFEILTQPKHGQVTLDDASSGAYTYTPDADYAGADSFTFKANNGQADSNTATVSITVKAAPNKPPVASDGSLTTDENSAASGVLKASDPEGNSLTFKVVAQPKHGQVTLDDTSSGAYTYTPDQDYSGVDSFTFKANDGQADSNTATVSVTVNAVTPPPPPHDNGGGGGFGWLSLFVLLGLGLTGIVSRRPRQ
jgi:VCBS repeat-containing protein